MRTCSVLLLALSLAACNHGSQSSDAVRQGVLDHLAKAGLNVAGMDVNLTAVQISGNQADASVSITPKGSSAGGMSMKYHLEQQSNKWVVVGRQDSGQPHGAGAAPPTGNPHGDSAPPAEAAPGGPGHMPSPQDLPPVKKK